MYPRFIDSISEEIYNKTLDWGAETWKDFRNNFCEDYYSIRDNDKNPIKFNFKVWKLRKIKEYNKIKKWQ